MKKIDNSKQSDFKDNHELMNSDIEMTFKSDEITNYFKFNNNKIENEI